MLYDATELRIRVWDQFATVFSYVKLFGLMHRIYPIDEHGERVSSTDLAAGYETILDGPASLFWQSRKYGIRMANFLPALPHCERWNLAAEILVDESANETREFMLDQTAGLQTHYTVAVSSTATSNERSPTSGPGRTRSGNWSARTT